MGLIMRRNLMAAKSGPTAKDYVQDGLIAMWDGIENSGWGQHDPNANVWKDLAGEYDLSVVGGAYFNDNSFVASGITQRAERTNCDVLIDSMVSIELVFSLGQIPTGTIGLFLWGTDRGERQISAGNGGIGFSQAGKVGAKGLTNKYIGLAKDKKLSVSCVYTSVSTASSIPYFMGEYVENPINNGYIDLDPNSSGGFSFASRMNNSWGINGTHVYASRIYNRPLTPAEIAANYAIDKARFNLPDVT